MVGPGQGEEALESVQPLELSSDEVAGQQNTQGVDHPAVGHHDVDPEPASMLAANYRAAGHGEIGRQPAGGGYDCLNQRVRFAQRPYRSGGGS